MYNKDSMNKSFTLQETANQQPTLKDEITTNHKKKQKQIEYFIQNIKNRVKVDEENLK